MCIERLRLICGIIGDSLTFLGGAILAWDALQALEAYKDRRILAESVRRLAGLKVEDDDGNVLANEEDVDVSDLRRAKRRAQVGFAILASGFFFLLVTRLL